MNGSVPPGDPGISKSRLARRLAILASSALVLSALIVPAASAADKVLVCHAAGQAGTTHFVTLEVPANEGGFPQGHFTEDGTTEAGHELDYLGACIEEPTPTDAQPTPTEPQPTPTEPQPTPTEPQATPTEPGPTPTLPVTGSEDPAAATPTLPTTSTDPTEGNGDSPIALLLVLLAAGAAGLVVLDPLSKRSR